MPHWFEPIAEHLGRAYLRYSFTKGTAQEVAFIADQLGLTPGQRVLDVGCGPGRHALELARRGFDVVGVDISDRFVRIAAADAALDAEGDAPANPAARRAVFVRADARRLPLRNGAFDVVLSLCQGGFGLLSGADEDRTVLAGMAAALAPRGRLVLSAFNAYFQVRYLEESAFDAATGVNHERTDVRSETGEPCSVELHTTCYTPRELRWLCEHGGLEVERLWSVEPGRYADEAPTIESPELLVIARRT